MLTRLDGLVEFLLPNTCSGSVLDGLLDPFELLLVQGTLQRLKRSLNLESHTDEVLKLRSKWKLLSWTLEGGERDEDAKTNVNFFGLCGSVKWGLVVTKESRRRFFPERQNLRKCWEKRGSAKVRSTIEVQQECLLLLGEDKSS